MICEKPVRKTRFKLVHCLLESVNESFSCNKGRTNPGIFATKDSSEHLIPCGPAQTGSTFAIRRAIGVGLQFESRNRGTLVHCLCIFFLPNPLATYSSFRCSN